MSKEKFINLIAAQTKKLSKKEVIRLGRECGLSEGVSMRTYENMFALGEGDLRGRHFHGAPIVLPGSTVTKATIIASGITYVPYRDLTPSTAAGIIVRRYSTAHQRRVPIDSFLMSEGISLSTLGRLLREISTKGTILGQRVYLNNLFKYTASDLLRLNRYASVHPESAKYYHTGPKKGLSDCEYSAKLHAARILYDNLKRLSETEVAR